MSDSYDAGNITVLEGLEAVRKRPGMYIGNTSQDGLHRCLGEIVDNSVDECMEGHATTIKVSIDNKNACAIVCDDGRGIPTDIHPKTGKSALETILTVLHAGGKFDQGNYQFAGGLHGVGASVTNALSKKLEVWVLRDEKIHYASFSEGKALTELETFPQSDMLIRFPDVINHTVWEKTGTLIRFYPDDSIFETTQFNIKQLIDYFKQIAYLNKGLKLIFEDKVATEQLLAVSDKELGRLEKGFLNDVNELVNPPAKENNKK